MTVGQAAAVSDSGKLHTYFIAADTVEWDYAPDPLPLIPHFDSDLIQTRKARPPEWEHLGMLGPVLRAEVGDTIRVTFKNNTGIMCTMHPHGLTYDKSFEGAYYFKDGLTLEQKPGDAVRPQKSFTYTWHVPESAGPGPHDPSSIIWMYHSHFHESRDINSGLFGPIIITRKGQAKTGGMPEDVDREFVVAFSVYDEGESAYFLENLARTDGYDGNGYDPRERRRVVVSLPC